VKESGVAGFVVSSWNGLAVPAKTPKAVIARLHKDIAAALNAEQVKKRLRELNVQAQSSSPEEAAELLASETRRWGDVMVRARIAPQ
jgi:tripartite-type tricarboxylate transporter receptor subunit TctC